MGVSCQVVPQLVEAAGALDDQSEHLGEGVPD
jgi:hypothetical protein